MSLKVDDVSSHVCNVTRLDLLLNLTSTKVSISDLSKSLCGIGEDKAVAMVESMLQNMDLGKLVQEVQDRKMKIRRIFQLLIVHVTPVLIGYLISFLCSFIA